MKLLLAFSVITTVQIQAQSDLWATEIRPYSLNLEWKGAPTSGYTCQYGQTTALEMGEAKGGQLVGLDPATCYYAQAWTLIDGDTLRSPLRRFATQSLSSGEIKVYFNRSVDNTASPLADALQITALEDTLVAYIARCQTTLDVCNYNTGSLPIVQAINAAQARGVQVRYIAAADEVTNNDELDQLSPAIPLLQRPDDGEVMHNKFLLLDAANADRCWVITGSANHTNNSLHQDYNNVILIQDQSLVQAYELEFEEMWGSSGTMPNAANAKFGAAKSDNTPHQFTIGGRSVQLYFSPSDGTSAKIEQALLSAQTDLSFAVFTFIHNDIGDAVKNREQAGVWVRGIIENIYYLGSEYAGLQSAGVAVQSHFSVPDWLHHKYGVVDATNVASDPLVITGSHNWTNSAEEDYDENTLIVHDAAIAAMYWEEFSMRYNELTTGLATLPAPVCRLYPNPTAHWIRIESPEAIELLRLVDAQGRVVREVKPAAVQVFDMDCSDLPAGLYWLQVQTKARCEVAALQIR